MSELLPFLTPEIEHLLGVMVLALLLGGFVKGLIGIGLPLIAVPILAHVVSVPTAIALMSAPILWSNTVQLFEAGRAREVTLRFRGLLIALVLGMAIAVQLLVSIPERQLMLAMGFIVTGFAILMALGLERRLPPPNERIAGPAVGLGAGFIGGLSSFYGPPIIMYLVALRLDRDAFIATVAVAFLVGGIPLWGTLAYQGFFGVRELLLTLFGLIPVYVGMKAGTRIRHRIPQEIFRLMVLAGLALIGLSLMRRGLVM